MAALGFVALFCWLAAAVSLVSPRLTTGGRLSRGKAFLAYLFAPIILIAVAKPDTSASRRDVLQSRAVAPAVELNDMGAVATAPEVRQTPVSAVVKAPAPVPLEQVRFLEAITKAKKAYLAAPNEMAAGAFRYERRNAICSEMKSAAAKNWVGRVTELSSNSEGRGVLSVDVGDGIILSTWNNAVSDVLDKTLMDPASPVFQKAARLAAGDGVVFSGTLFPNERDCVEEKSMTIRGSMMRPEFAFRFSDINHD